MTRIHIRNVILTLALLVLLTGSVSADVVEAGSQIDATLTSVTTHLSTSTVNNEPGSPVSLSYDISAQGITRPDGTYVPMSGSVTAYISAHLAGSRNSPGTIAGDLSYHDITTASGLVRSFKKTMTYQSDTA